jgi:hypothetical protein
MPHTTKRSQTRQFEIFAFAFAAAAAPQNMTGSYSPQFLAVQSRRRKPLIFTGFPVPISVARREAWI